MAHDAGDAHRRRIEPSFGKRPDARQGAWVPTASTWGVDNRTAAFRFIPGDASQRIEPPDAVIGNAYDVEDSLPPEWRFPPTLRDAAARFAQSAPARQLFGTPFVDHFAATRLWESREHERHVDDWQLARYFEIV